MAKPDFPALFPPGIHKQTLTSLEAVCVHAFPSDPRRAVLFERLKTWVTDFKRAKAAGRIWIDGSFLTQKQGPHDIDCVVWSPYFTEPPTVVEHQILEELFNKAAAKAKYDLDVYLEIPQPDQVLHREAYWKGLFGYCHDRVTAKGFAELDL